MYDYYYSVEIRTSSCRVDRKVSLKTDESQVSQGFKDVKKKWEYYQITFFFIFLYGLRNDGLS